jgi:hypothetical protein
MAAPMVSGVAALLKSYFPSLTMLEIKYLMFSSSIKYKELNPLCTTGGVVNVYKAVKACMEMEKWKRSIKN